MSREFISQNNKEARHTKHQEQDKVFDNNKLCLIKHQIEKRGQYFENKIMEQIWTFISRVITITINRGGFLLNIQHQFFLNRNFERIQEIFSHVPQTFSTKITVISCTEKNKNLTFAVPTLLNITLTIKQKIYFLEIVSRWFFKHFMKVFRCKLSQASLNPGTKTLMIPPSANFLFTSRRSAFNAKHFIKVHRTQQFSRLYFQWRALGALYIFLLPFLKNRISGESL